MALDDRFWKRFCFKKAEQQGQITNKKLETKIPACEQQKTKAGTKSIAMGKAPTYEKKTT